MTTEAPQTTREVVETVLLDPQERRKLIALAHARYGLATEDAEDLLQETALELLRQRQYVHSPRGYLYVVFQNRCARLFRSRKRRLDDSEVSENLADPSSESYGRSKTDGRIALRQALYRISSTCRKLLAAYYIEGKSVRETAAAMARAASGVGPTINRCLNSLRECLS